MNNNDVVGGIITMSLMLAAPMAIGIGIIAGTLSGTDSLGFGTSLIIFPILWMFGIWLGTRLIT